LVEEEPDSEQGPTQGKSEKEAKSVEMVLAAKPTKDRKVKAA
jgi:hypothetical protein